MVRDFGVEHLLGLCQRANSLPGIVDIAWSRAGDISKMPPRGSWCGVEYSWGKSKMHFRRHTDHVAHHLYDNTVAFMSPEVLTLTRVRRYARKARAYRRAYSTSSTAMSRRSIEKQVKLYKRHRSALDTDWKSIKDN